MEREEQLNDKTINHAIVRALKGIKFGYIQITIQDSRVVQIDRTEKVRMDQTTKNERSY